MVGSVSARASANGTLSRDARTSGKLIAALIVGNTIEWYDFIVYGFLAAILARQFFPPADPTAALLGSYAVFALSFLVRPIGGLLIGLYADRVGRGAALVFIMASMSVAMLIMTFTPTYASVGIVATVLLLVARVLQAVSAGGEFASAAAFLIEAAPVTRRGLYSGLYSAGPPLAAVLSALVGLLITLGMTNETRDSWGWRVPFALGLLIAPIGLYIRLQLGRIGFAPATPRPRVLAADLLKVSWRLLVGLSLASVANASAYIFLVYAPTYVVTTLKLPAYISFVGLIVAGVASTLLVPLMGAIADRVGRKGFTLFGLFALLLLVVPVYAWLSTSPTLAKFLVAAFAFAVLGSMYFAVYAAAIAELFDPAIRATAMALCYNVSALVFGAFSLVAVTWLQSVTGSPLVPGYYVAGTALFCLLVNGVHGLLRRPPADAA